MSFPKALGSARWEKQKGEKSERKPTLEKKCVSNKLGLSPVAKLLHSCTLGAADRVCRSGL